MDQTSQIGDFTIFGYSPDPKSFLQEIKQSHLGIIPKMLDFCSAGSLFFHSTYGDIAETDEAVCIKLGFLHGLDISPLSAEKLLLQGNIRPGFYNFNNVRGNALVVCLGKKILSISAFKTLLGVPQLYYAQVNGGIICSDRLRCIVRLLDHVELNEEIIPMHFLFRSTPGELTYYRQIRRLLPGGYFNWLEGELNLKIAQDFRFSDNSKPSSWNYGYSLNNLYETMMSVVGDYVGQVEGSGKRIATLLSGGVDSSLLQYLINQKTSHRPSRSYSFAIHAPSFDFEIEYAKKSKHQFRTEHTFINIRPEDFPGLIIRTIDSLAQPPILETEPSMLAIAEFVHENNADERYFVSGQGADTLFGLPWSRKLKGLHIASRIPGAPGLLKTIGVGIKPFKHVSQMLIKGGEMLANSDDPQSFLSPINLICVYTNMDKLQRCFGDEVLKKAFQYRRELAARYLETDNYLEEVHLIDLITDTYELGVQRQELFLAHKREKIHPFFDDDIIRTSFTIPPNSRYIKGLRPKYLLKDLLTKKTSAAAARQRKGSSIWEADMLKWMQSGPLCILVKDI